MQDDGQSAWAWYDPETGSLKHVSLIKDHAHPDDTMQIAMDLQSAKDILTGTSRLNHYRVKTNTDGTVSVAYIAASMLELALRFPDLTECVPFDKKWQHEDNFDSPIRIHKDPKGMDIFVVAYIIQAVVYITLKNEPSWLIKTVNLSNAMSKHGVGPIRVDLDPRHDYTAYVRYHAS